MALYIGVYRWFLHLILELWADFRSLTVMLNLR